MEKQVKTTETRREDCGRPGSARINEREKENWSERSDYTTKDVNVKVVKEENEGMLDVSQDPIMNRQTDITQRS